MTEDINLKKYLLIFIGALIAFWLLLAAMKIITGTSLFGISVLGPFIGAVTASHYFVRDHHRAPNDDEASKLISLSLFYTVGLTLLQLIFLLLTPETKQLILGNGIAALALMGVILIVFLAIAYFMIRWGYKGQAQKMAADRKR